MTNRRLFMGTAALASVAWPSLSAAQSAPHGARGPVLLTVSGAINRSNRGPLDPLLDQMMVRQKVSFDRARAFDFGALTSLPAVTIKPTLEYDNKRHTLRGPLLLDVMKDCGVKVTAKTAFFLRAVDGYAAQVSAADATKYRFIVATHLDGQPMTLGGLGPLWAVYDADRYPAMVAKPVTERFVSCPWATYHIEVKEV
jgi:hypothetical protein